MDSSVTTLGHEYGIPLPLQLKAEEILRLLHGKGGLNGGLADQAVSLYLAHEVCNQTLSKVIAVKQHRMAENLTSQLQNFELRVNRVCGGASKRKSLVLRYRTLLNINQVRGTKYCSN